METASTRQSLRWVASGSRGEGHLADVVGDRERGAGLLDDLLSGHPGRRLAQDQPVTGDVDDGEVGDDPVDARLAGERQRALARRSWATRRGRRAPS